MRKWPATEQVQRPERPYTLAMLRAKADPSRGQPVRAVFEADGRGPLQPAGTAARLPADRWMALGRPFRAVAGGIEIHTGPEPVAAAAE